MESAAKIDDVIKLGNNLVTLLSRGRQSDLLSDWMAHHVAECIIAARNTKGRAKTAAEERCVSTILQIWRHRAALPDGHRPFEEFEAILKTFARLDPDHDRWFYFDLKPKWQSSENPTTQPKPDSVEQNVDLAVKVDRAARTLIEYFINEATKTADKPITRKLLKSGEVDEDKPDVEMLRKLLATKDFAFSKKVADQENLERQLNARIKSLKNFNLAAGVARREYESQLRDLRKKRNSPKRSPAVARKK